MGRGNADGTFQITNIPDGDYVLTFWDEDQAYLLTQANVSIVNGQALDMGVLDVAAWHSQVYGKVCNDTNRNGKCEPGEPGFQPGLLLNLLGRDNSVQFYGDNTATTDNNGNYSFPRAYPLGQWVVDPGLLGAVLHRRRHLPDRKPADRDHDDGQRRLRGRQLVQPDRAPDPHGLGGPHLRDPANANLGPTNGGIVGEVYDTTTRNELDPRFQAIESYEPGLPGATVHLYAPVKCDPNAASGRHELHPDHDCAFGSTYYLTSATTGDGPMPAFRRPRAATRSTCSRPTPARPGIARPTASRAAPMAPRSHEQVLPPSTGGHDCLEAPLMSSQVGNNNIGYFMQVNGNYGFTQITTTRPLARRSWPRPSPVADYLVKVDPSDDRQRPAGLRAGEGRGHQHLLGRLVRRPRRDALQPAARPTARRPAAVAPAIPPFPWHGVRSHRERGQ